MKNWQMNLIAVGAALEIGSLASYYLFIHKPLPMEQVWNEMKYELDRDQYGVNDKWVAGCPPKGDCEDMALCLLEKLEATGVSMESSRLIICRRSDGRAHAIVRFDGRYLDPTYQTDTRKMPCEFISSLTYEAAKARAVSDGSK